MKRGQWHSYGLHYFPIGIHNDSSVFFHSLHFFDFSYFFCGFKWLFLGISIGFSLDFHRFFVNFFRFSVEFRRFFVELRRFHVDFRRISMYFRRFLGKSLNFHNFCSLIWYSIHFQRITIQNSVHFHEFPFIFLIALWKMLAFPRNNQSPHGWTNYLKRHHITFIDPRWIMLISIK